MSDVTLSPLALRGTVTRTTSTSSSNVALDSDGVQRVWNSGSTATDFVYIKFGDSTVEAGTSDFPLGAGESVIIDAGGHTHIACEAAANTPTVYITSLGNR